MCETIAIDLTYTLISTQLIIINTTNNTLFGSTQSKILRRIPIVRKYLLL